MKQNFMTFLSPVILLLPPKFYLFLPVPLEAFYDNPIFIFLFLIISLSSKHRILINLTHLPMSRVLGLYTPVNPERVNSEFIGIGEKFSQKKKLRMESDQRRRQVESNFSFTLKIDEELEKSLLEKQKELHRLQATRKRHHEDISQKQKEEERKRRQLLQLRSKSKQQRIAIKQGIKSAKETLKSERLSNKKTTKQQLFERSLLFKKQNQMQQTEKCMKFKSVEIGKKLGNERVNQYFRQKNLESYNNYLRMMDYQEQKSYSNEELVHNLNSQMKKLEKKINKKQKRLKQVMNQINLYAVQGNNQRKTNFLATVSVFRHSHTSGSWRSRPTQLIKSSNTIKDADNQDI